MSRAGRVVTYAKLLTAVWGADCREEVEYLRTFVRQLRKKIEDDPSNPSTCSPMFTSATGSPMRNCSARRPGKARTPAARRSRFPARRFEGFSDWVLDATACSKNAQKLAQKGQFRAKIRGFSGFVFTTQITGGAPNDSCNVLIINMLHGIF